MNRVLIQESWQLLMTLEQRLKATRGEANVAMHQRIMRLWKYAWRRYERRVHALTINPTLTIPHARHEPRPAAPVVMVSA